MLIFPPTHLEAHSSSTFCICHWATFS